MLWVMNPALEPAQLPRYARVGLVGSAGLEPTTSRVSDERSHPVSYEPAEDGGVEPHGPSTVTSFQGPLPRRRRIFQRIRRGERRARSAALGAPSRFRGGACDPGRFTLQGAEDGGDDPHGL